MTERKPLWLRFAVAAALTVAAAGVRLALFQVMGTRHAFLTFYPGVILAALYGGLWPGLLAAALSTVLADYFLLQPLHHLVISYPADWVGLAIFLLSSILISWTAEAMKRAERRARAAELQAGLEKERQKDAETKEFLGAIVQSSEDAILSKDLDGIVLSWNGAAERMFGYKAGEIIGRNIALIIPPDHAKEEELIIQQIRRGERVNAYDTERVGKNGVRLEVSVTVSPLRDAQGRIVGASKIIHDITERKRKEEQLRLLSSAVEAAVNGIALTDRAGKILWINPAFTRLTGYSLQEAVGQNPRVLKSGKHSPEFYSQMWATIVRGESWSGELVNRRKDGSLYTEQMTIAPVRAGGAGVTHFVAIKQDISARKRAEDRTRLMAETVGQLLKTDAPRHIANEICQRVMDYMDCQVFFNFLVDEQPERLRLNACAGVSEEQAAKIQWLDFGAGVSGCVARDQCRIVAENILSTPDPRTELVKALGLQAYACHPLMAEGRLIGTLSFGAKKRPHFTDDELSLIKDVADQVAIALQRQNAQAALRHAALELERSNVELQQFAYVASHDLQEPLRAVAGYLGLIDERLRDKLDDKGRHYMAGAIEGAERMHTLINDLLELSRVGSRGGEFQSADLNAILDIALKNLAVTINQTNAVVTRSSLPALAVDANQIAMLFQNLIGNAIKFRGGRPPEIDVSARWQAGHWVFAVRDNGIGIEPQYYEQIFQIFRRLHTRKQYPGTGIGLAICKKIVERHGGRIWVQSQPGLGSTFLFTIPDQRP
jgi:PAS domain S-box-containing protein